MFAAYFFRLFEVNGFVKAISVVEDPDAYYKAMGIIYKIDYFFIALIMVSCLVSFILMNKDKKITAFLILLGKNVPDFIFLLQNHIVQTIYYHIYYIEFINNGPDERKI